MRSFLLLAVLVCASCSDPSAPRAPVDVRLVSGANQVGGVLQELPEPVVVEVRDADGRPVAGVAVAWAVSSGGGSVSALSSSTGADGRAGVQWTLGAAAGENRLGVAVAGLDPLTIVATAQAGTAASLQLMSGDGQTGLEHLPLGDAIVVAVVDEHGNGVRNVVVAFQPQAGGAVAPRTATTDVAGVASAIWRLGAAGEQSVLVTAAGLAEQPVQFSATALAPSAVALLASGEDVVALAASRGEDRYFRIVVPSNATHLAVGTTGTDGDADLYVRHERLPDTGSSACKSTSPFATESCTVERPAAGNWYVLIDAFTAYSGLTLRASFATGGSIALDVTGLPGDVEADVMVTGPGGHAERVRSSDTLSALVPGLYSVTAAYVQDGSAVYAGTPETQTVDVQAGVVAAGSVDYAPTSGVLNLDIVNAYITQSVQRTDGSVPLVAGRDGLLRVFARGNALSNATPIVRARLYNGGMLVRTFEIHAPATVLPVSHDEGQLTTSWNAIVPGALIQPGLTLLLDIDPANAIEESNESDNMYPRSGPPLLLDVRPVAPLRARLVPVVQANGTQPDLNAANSDTYTTDAQAVYPLQRIDADVRAPYTFSATLTASYDTAWQRLLSEINALRIAEAPERYYYGVFKPAYASGGTGLGYMHQRAAIGVDWPNYRAFTLAHEWGHNFGRHHVDCGGPASPDPDYPYASGRLGHHGYDIRTNAIRALESHYDLMSYCSPTWTSDYTYEAVLSFFAPAGGPPGVVARGEVRGDARVRGIMPWPGSAAVGGLSGVAAGSAEPSLLIWGRISPDGAVLEPSFEVLTTPQLPSGAGPYRIIGTSASGAVVLDVAFDAYELDHLPGVRLFAYAVPLRMMGGEVPAELRLSGAGEVAVRRAMAAGARIDVSAVRDGGDGVRFRWNDARAPLLVIRDGRSGEILSLARGGDARVVTTAPEVQVHVSNGVRSTMRRIAVPR